MENRLLSQSLLPLPPNGYGTLLTLLLLTAVLSLTTTAISEASFFSQSSESSTQNQADSLALARLR